jgi:methylmalonyl-CoA mutase C-terminal domain/subunit
VLALRCGAVVIDDISLPVGREVLALGRAVQEGQEPLAVPSVRVKPAAAELNCMSVDGKQRSIRCLVAKVGLDGHDRGAHVIARAFRDAGFEVIYSGLHKAPEEIVQAAVQEDVDVLGISILSGAHNTLVPRIVDGLKEYDAFEDTLILVGGVIPDDDKAELKEMGVAEVFGPGTELEQTIEFVRENVPERR